MCDTVARERGRERAIERAKLFNLVFSKPEGKTETSSYQTGTWSPSRFFCSLGWARTSGLREPEREIEHKQNSNHPLRRRTEDRIKEEHSWCCRKSVVISPPRLQILIQVLKSASAAMLQTAVEEPQKKKEEQQQLGAHANHRHSNVIINTEPASLWGMWLVCSDAMDRQLVQYPRPCEPSTDKPGSIWVARLRNYPPPQQCIPADSAATLVLAQQVCFLTASVRGK